MRYEWFVCKYKNGELIDKTPHPMSREEADSLCDLSKLVNKGFTWKVKHRKDLHDRG